MSLDMYERKAQFVKRISDALIECGDGWYNHVCPLEYHLNVTASGAVIGETVTNAVGNEYSVYGDSLKAILSDICKGKLL